ncbi:MAG: gliding motility-associated C-terminal domain-containing protein [Sphingobacteriales bacterium]|nr:MAG: gliding motility-associated C-terminal domain-containing protein [Sphingobacteriales bacterium]
MFASIAVSQVSGGNAVLSYSVNPNFTGTALVTITVKDDGGTENGGTDSFSRTFNVVVNPGPTPLISSNTLNKTIDLGVTTMLTASGGITYSWATAAGIVSGQNSAVLTIRPLVTTTYTVEVTNASGCKNSSSITITVVNNIRTLVVNNILTPNGDGQNDLFMIKDIELYPNNTLKVYDRLGRVVFEKRSYQNDWGGTANGKNLNEGTLFYVISLSDKESLKGFIVMSDCFHSAIRSSAMA